jgi:glycosyltransferase involved in cell wall biosynthesis
MNFNLKISIITCTFNRIEKLKKNIRSVKNQNYKNYEHYILDDGSNDGTKEYIEKINDAKIKYIRFEDNCGQPTILFNSNIFNKINGDYVVLLDSDDYLFDGAFEIFKKYFLIYGNEIWNYAFDFSDEKGKSFKSNINSPENYTKIIKVNSDECFRDDHPRNYEKKGYRDFLNFRNKLFYENLKKYFTTPDFWYSSLYEVGMNTKFEELYIYNKIYFMDFDNDTVTRGFNINKYKKHTLVSREKIFYKYKSHMDKNFFSYTLKSLIFNYLVNKNYKKKIMKLIFENISFFKKNILFSIFIFLLLFFPHRLLIILKSKIKLLQKRRY